MSSPVVFVTGGALGIGRAICLHFAQLFACVVIADVNESAGKNLESQIRESNQKVIFVKMDVRIKSEVLFAVNEAVRIFGKIDVCVANAGIARIGSVVTMEENEFENVWNVNGKGVFLTVQACAREMIKAKSKGSVVIVASANAV